LRLQRVSSDCKGCPWRQTTREASNIRKQVKGSSMQKKKEIQEGLVLQKRKEATKRPGQTLGSPPPVARRTAVHGDATTARHPVTKRREGYLRLHHSRRQRNLTHCQSRVALPNQRPFEICGNAPPSPPRRAVPCHQSILCSRSAPKIDCKCIPDATPVSVPPALFNKPTESNAGWQELGYPDAQTALLCQRIAERRHPSKDNCCWRSSNVTLTPSEIGLRQIATAQPVQPEGEIRASNWGCKRCRSR
jgi:hypothetical protein